MKNPMEVLVENLKQFATIEDAELKKAIFNLADKISSDTVIADYEHSSDTQTAVDELQLELNEYEARLLAEAEKESDKVEASLEEEDEIPLIADEDEDEDEVPLLETDET